MRLPSFLSSASLLPRTAVAAVFLFAAAAEPTRAAESGQWLARAFGVDSTVGSGKVAAETRIATGFDSIAVGGDMTVVLRQGTHEGVRLSADDNLLPLIETTVKRGELVIKAARRNLNLESKSIRIVVQAKAIDELSIGGSGSIRADQLRASKMKLDIGGSGSIDVKRLDADRVEVSIGGSGDVNLAGAVKKIEASIAGSGNVAAPGLVADEAEVTVAGSGDAKLAVRTKLDVTIAGAGAIGYYGDPVVKRTIIGSGAIKRLGALPQQP